MEILYVVIHLNSPGKVTNPKKWTWCAEPGAINPTKFHKGYKTEEEALKESKGRYEIKQVICS